MALAAILGGEFSLLGIGGMAIVFRVCASDGDSVVKTLRHSFLPGSEQDQRLLREFQILAHLHNEHVVGVPNPISHGVCEGRVWIRTSYLAGTALSSVEDISREKQAHIILGLLAILSSVHAAGVVHRDIKPANIILSEDQRQVFLIDFNVARLQTHEELHLHPMTQLGQTVGTLGFISPEQATSSDSARPSDDLWSVGGVLLCWFIPDLERRLEFLYRSEKSEQEEVLKSTAPDVSPMYRAVVLKAIQKQSDRFQHAIEFERELRLCSESGIYELPTAVSGAANFDPRYIPRPRVRSEPAVRKRTGSLVSVTLLLVCVLVTTLGWRYLDRRDTRSDSASSCGAPPRRCVIPPNSTPQCVDGDCRYVCRHGFADLDQLNVNGCEVNLLTDARNCGRPNNACTAGVNELPVCSEGACTSTCVSLFRRCASAGCVDLDLDPRHCGDCERSCVVGERCVRGRCEATCDSGFQLVRNANAPLLCVQRTEVTVRAFRNWLRSDDPRVRGIAVHEVASVYYPGVNTGPAQDREDARCNLNGNREDWPMNCVSFPVASNYCSSLRARLLTVQEWRNAANGLDAVLGACRSRTDLCACLSGGGRFVLGGCVAGTGVLDRAESSGVVDLVGNVSEWVASDGDSIVHTGMSWSDPPTVWSQGSIYNLQEESLGFRSAGIGFRCSHDPR